MSERLTIARPYARAAFETAAAAQAVAAWSDFLQALAEATAAAQLRRAFSDPRLSRAQLADAVVGAFGDGLAPEQVNFVRLLAQARRLTVADAVCELFQDYRAAARNSVAIEVTSAYPLDDEQHARLRRILERTTGRTVTIESRTDEALLGGAVVRFGDQVIDGSVRARLNQLSAELMH